MNIRLIHIYGKYVMTFVYISTYIATYLKKEIFQLKRLYFSFFPNFFRLNKKVYK